jgi:hypothetical protein
MACVFFCGVGRLGCCRDLATRRPLCCCHRGDALARHHLQPFHLAGRSLASPRGDPAFRHRLQHDCLVAGRRHRHCHHRHRHCLAGHHVPLPRQRHAAMGASAAPGSADLHHWLCLCRSACLCGPIQTALRNAMGWSRADYWFPDLGSASGVAFLFTLVLYPYVYLAARAAFLSQSPALLEASRILGHGPWRTFLRIGLPLARPAVAAGAALALLEALADFGTVHITASRPSRPRSTGPGTAWGIARARRRSPWR